jgi:hypothetical protein
MRQYRLRGGALGQQVADEAAGPHMLDPAHHRHIALLRHPHGAPATRRRDQDQHRQQGRVQDGEHAGRGDQGEGAVHRGHAGTDHAASGVGTELGDVDQPPEVRVLDGLQFDRRGRGQVLGGCDPLDQGLKAARP